MTSGDTLRGVEWLNYHHLLYFWAVARYGSVARASAELHLSQPTISGQVRRLEDVLGAKLFDRAGRRLVPTPIGRTVFRYADEIFSLGQDLLGMLKGRPSARPLRLTVGVADALPRILVHKLIEPAFHLDKTIHLVCREDRVVEDFLSRLTGQELDLVLADRPLGPGIRAHAFNHLLGETGTIFLASEKLARRIRRGFPRSLDGAPCLLPSNHATVRRRRYKVRVVGRAAAIRQQFYAISVDQRLHHPAVVAIVKAARQELFRQSTTTRGATTIK